MTQTSPPSLADLCAELPRLKRDAARNGQHAPLRQFVQVLHDILELPDPSARAASLDATLTQIWRTYGLLIDPRSSWHPETNLPGPLSAAPVKGAYVCPRGHCGREEKRGPGGALPLCALYENEPLTFEGQP
ncbi:hypothetical protein ACFWIJ_16145 [Streptomyces sp. NPDC127079]|uniref:hypothetical protein n=1 Tax=Streptomyces sp. NPDC127079 TaxID=3347132 RepID=UPI0036499F79